uniref:Variant surface glycoprotein 1125.1025 n=1 Tax=Trypanosoma brucei TaxID=5691 RepID=A0A1J0R663_9TRYP|nr:variant surface glycoprotein 1125.1025 [Trypanosoma brucei]
MARYSLVLLYLTVAACKPGAATAGEVMAEFLSLCSAWHAGKSLLATTYNKPTAPQELKDILNLNMTLAPADWQSIFNEEAKHKTWQEYKEANSDKLKGADWQTVWPYLKDARQATKKAITGWPVDIAKAIAPHDKQRFTRIVKVAAANALNRFLATQQTPTYGPEEAATAAKSAATAALCGTQTDANGAAAPCEDITATPAKENTCGNAAAHKGGSSIRLDLICLCSENTGDQCFGQAGHQTAMGGANLKAGVLAELIEKCGEGGDNVRPDELVSLSVAQFSGRLADKKDAGAEMAVYLGKTVNTHCGSSDSACVDYTNVFKNTKKGVYGIAWVANLKKATHAWQTIETKKRADAAAIATLTAIKDEIAMEVATAPLEQAKQPAASADEQSNAGKAGRKQECDKHHASQENCTKAQCNYDENAADGKKCKPKTGSENTAEAGTGEKKDGAATTVNCGQHNEKTKCEEENKGKTTPVCGWRKGKDDEDDKDTEKFRNVSFLIINKLALISFTFKSLVTF